MEDEGAFNSSVDGRFAALDADHDGMLTYAEMWPGSSWACDVLEKHFGMEEAIVDPEELANSFRY